MTEEGEDFGDVPIPMPSGLWGQVEEAAAKVRFEFTPKAPTGIYHFSETGEYSVMPEADKTEAEKFTDEWLKSHPQ